MDNKNLLKAAIMLLGGFVVFALVKPKNNEPNEEGTKKSFDSLTPAPNAENAEIVMDAYVNALQNNESPARLTELNKECMKEFGMRCYVDGKSGELVVCDVKGEIILSK
jgi:uncharacterized protein YgiB involved in biofilm formation